MDFPSGTAGRGRPQKLIRAGAGLSLGPRQLAPTFERGDHAGAPLLQEALELLPGPLQHGIVVDVAAKVPVVLLKQAVPGQATLLPIHTGNTHTRTNTPSA